MNTYVLFHSDDVSNPDGPLRFEKIFKRMDSDGDGHLTVQEFKRGLRRLRCTDEKKWSLRLIRRLFNMRESGKDGILLLSDLSALIRGVSTLEEQVAARDEGGQGYDSDEEDLFGRKRETHDMDIIRKVRFNFHFIYSAVIVPIGI